MQLYANGKTLNLNQVQIMGILNITPDSFSDSGQFFALDKALYHAEEMLKNGASIIDVGGESTRPGAQEVSEEEELARVIPVVEALRQRFDCWISVDTSKALVMQESAKVGMDLINDIRALSEPFALETVAELNLPVCLMHMQGQPRTMQQQPQYDDVVQEVLAFLQERTNLALSAGIKKENILWDVGFGFGKTLQHNYKLLQQLGVFCQNYPVLAGLSRKSMFGQLLNKPVEERLIASVTGALLAVQNGARILRVHDVEATKDALQVWLAMKQA